MKGKAAYLTGLALRAESAILSNGRGDLGAFEQHPPGIFVSCAEEPVQSSVLHRVELPQVELLLLAREDPAVEHDLDHVDNFELLVHHILNTYLESGQLSRTTQDRPFSF